MAAWLPGPFQLTNTRLGKALEQAREGEMSGRARVLIAIIEDRMCRCSGVSEYQKCPLIRSQFILLFFGNQ